VLKFLRKYQKWMLVIFCAVLMAAFLIQPVVSILYPDPGKSTIATVYDGKEITLNDLRQAQADIQFLGQLGQSTEGANAFGQALNTLIPQGEGDAERALGWLLMLHAAKHEGILVSNNESFSLLSALIGDIEDAEDLEDVALKQGTTAGNMLRVAGDYLAAEQYRQLITGIEYRSEEGISASPGLARVQRISDPSNRTMPQIGFFVPFQRYQQISGELMQLTPPSFDTQSQNILDQQAQILALLSMQFDVDGAPRISAPLLVNAVQSQFARVTGQALVLDLEPYRVGQTASAERMAELFEKYKGDPAGTGEPMGFGYRIPDRAMVEAIYIPIDNVRALAATQVTEEQIGEELRQNKMAYATWQPRQPETEETESGSDDAAETPGEGETNTENPGDNAPDPNQGVPPQDPAAAEPQPVTEGEPAAGEVAEGEATEGEAAEPAPPVSTIDNDPAKMIQLRSEIRAMLIEVRADELVQEIARAVREELDKQVRGFKDVSGYRQLPSDFEPVALQTVADRVAQRFSTEQVTLELVVIPAEDRWINREVVQAAEDQRVARMGSLKRREVLVASPTGFRYVEIADEPLIGEPGAVEAPAPTEETEDAAASEGEEGEEAEEAAAPPIAAWQALITSRTRDTMARGQFGPQPLPFFSYLMSAKQLRDTNPRLPRTGLQPGVPSAIMVDDLRSAYIFRITRSDPAHAPESMDEVREQLEKDAITAQAYDELLAKKDELLASARGGNLYSILPDGGAVQEVGPFTPISPPSIEGVVNTGKVIGEVLDLADKLREQGNLVNASDADRTIIVELPAEQKLVVFKLDAFNTLSQRRYEREAGKEWVASLAYAEAMPAERGALVSPLTVEALKQQTGFKATEDYTLGNDEEQADESESESE